MSKWKFTGPNDFISAYIAVVLSAKSNQYLVKMIASASHDEKKQSYYLALVFMTRRIISEEIENYKKPLLWKIIKKTRPVRSYGEKRLCTIRKPICPIDVTSPSGYGWVVVLKRLSSSVAKSSMLVPNQEWETTSLN
jgi:hypothetical protein